MDGTPNERDLRLVVHFHLRINLVLRANNGGMEEPSGEKKVSAIPVTDRLVISENKRSHKTKVKQKKTTKRSLDYFSFQQNTQSKSKLIHNE
jgi:hypothetical protein